MSEITAIILAGGTAPRMRPLSLDKPKSIISFIGKPLLSFLIISLKLNNLLEIVINTSFEQGEAREYFSTGSNFGVNIKYYESKKWYGTAGTTKDLIDKINKWGHIPFS